MPDQIAVRVAEPCGVSGRHPGDPVHGLRILILFEDHTPVPQLSDRGLQIGNGEAQLRVGSAGFARAPSDREERAIAGLIEDPGRPLGSDLEPEDILVEAPQPIHVLRRQGGVSVSVAKHGWSP